MHDPNMVAVGTMMCVDTQHTTQIALLLEIKIRDDLFIVAEANLNVRSILRKKYPK